MISGSPKQLATSDLHEIFFFTTIVDCFVFLFVLSCLSCFGCGILEEVFKGHEEREKERL